MEIKKTDDLGGARVTVVGLGATGRSVTEYLCRKGAEVTVTDSRPIDDLKEQIGGLSDYRVIFDLGNHSSDSFLKADLIVVSPGVPLSIEPLRRARKAGIPITGEIELASMGISAPIIGITGTNGKSTVTTLVGEMLKQAGMKTFVGGNLGTPLIDLVMSGEDADIVVIELSSFQLETVETLKPRVGVLLNITPDHLDRYRDFDDYARTKCRLFARQGSGDTAIMNLDDPYTGKIDTRARGMYFSRLKASNDGAYLDGNEIVIRNEGRDMERWPAKDITLVGAHNLENVMAAMCCALALKIDLGNAFRAAAGFTGLEHRMETVGKFDDVTYVNDSKGTNVGAVIKSLEGFEVPVILIAGGRDKAGDFKTLKKTVREKVKLLILIGEASGKMADALADETRTVFADDMKEAVLIAQKNAAPRDVVLLSPACASFDMFRDYVHRGRVFKELVMEAAA